MDITRYLKANTAITTDGNKIGFQKGNSSEAMNLHLVWKKDINHKVGSFSRHKTPNPYTF